MEASKRPRRDAEAFAVSCCSFIDVAYLKCVGLTVARSMVIEVCRRRVLHRQDALRRRAVLHRQDVLRRQDVLHRRADYLRRAVLQVLPLGRGGQRNHDRRRSSRGLHGQRIRLYRRNDDFPSRGYSPSGTTGRRLERFRCKSIPVPRSRRVRRRKVRSCSSRRGRQVVVLLRLCRWKPGRWPLVQELMVRAVGRCRARLSVRA